MSAPAWARYAITIFVVLLAWLGRQALMPIVGHDRLPFLFFFPATALASWYGGFGPGALAAMLGGIAAEWFYIDRSHALGLHGSFDTVALAGYFISCAFIVGAIESMHRSQRKLVSELAERQKVELKLSEEKSLLAVTIASIGDAVLATDAGGRVNFLNAEAERLTGWNAAEAQGQALPTVFRIINEYSREPVENPVERVLRIGKVVALANHTVLIARDGKETPIDDSAAPIRSPDGSLSGVILVFRDLTERQAALRTSARLAAIVESSGEVILAKDLNGIIRSWNEAAQRLFGYTAQEAVGKPVTMLFPPDRLAEEDSILQRLRQGRLVERFETIRVTKDGRPIPVSVSISPVKDPEGRVIGASKIIQDISTLVAAREELLEEKELLATTLASIGDAVILTDAAGKVSFLNKEAERLTGWNKESSKGLKLTEVFKIINQENCQPVEDPVAKVMRLGRVVGLANHTLLIHKDGREIPIDDSAAPIRKGTGPLLGVVLVFRDFSEQWRTQRQQKDLYSLVRAVNQARALPEIYEAALEAITRCASADRSAILFLEQDGVMRFKAWQGLSGVYRQKVEGHSPWAPDQRDAQPVCIKDTSELTGELKSAIETEGIRALGFIPISYEGKLLGKFMVYYNQPHVFSDEELRQSVTVASQVALAVQRRQTEEHLEKLVRDRTAKLQEMMAELQHVSYAITHDMRAPLRAMSTFAGIILEELTSAESTSADLIDACRRIISSASRLDQLIQDSLNYTKAVLQELPLHPVDLALLIPSLLESYPNLQADKADIRIEDPLPTVLGEESLLTQCFSNLLGNAVKFVSRGIRPQVRITVRQSGDFAHISVSDNGIGIAREAQHRLFGMFERLTSGYEGTGIGLAIVRKVVDRMGGKVGVESEPGKGSTFWVELRTMAAAAESRQISSSNVTA